MTETVPPVGRGRELAHGGLVPDELLPDPLTGYGPTLAPRRRDDLHL